MTASTQKLVLVVDDDESVRKLLVRALATRYAIAEATDGQAALELLSGGLAPDLIICDVMMPRVDGLEFAKNVKANDDFRNVPFVFLTARGTAMDLVSGINVGARHYLMKPVNLRELLDKAAKILGS